MMPTDPLDAGICIGRALDAKGIPYALGGALAYGLWAIPRATIDVDINIFLDDDALDGALQLLQAIGVDLDAAQAKRDSANRGMFSGHWGDYRIDVFTPSIDFAWEAMRTRVAKEVGGERVWFLSAEALAVFKLLFFRLKDVVDLQRLVAVQGKRLDAAYVREKLVAMLGENDERVSKWDELTAD